MDELKTTALFVIVALGFSVYKVAKFIHGKIYPKHICANCHKELLRGNSVYIDKKTSYCIDCLKKGVK